MTTAADSSSMDFTRAPSLEADITKAAWRLGDCSGQDGQSKLSVCQPNGQR